eukprot:XP_002591183.1 hypothetical protein BRAFLDRAFT_105385 [Branchiostoma floridae]
MVLLPLEDPGGNRTGNHVFSFSQYDNNVMKASTTSGHLQTSRKQPKPPLPQDHCPSQHSSELTTSQHSSELTMQHFMLPPAISSEPAAGMPATAYSCPLLERGDEAENFS